MRLVRDGVPTLKYQAELEKLPLMIPAYNISTIGAGGGSIARVEGGLLKVGPQSAGLSLGQSVMGAAASSRHSPMRPSNSAILIRIIFSVVRSNLMRLRLVQEL